MKIPHRKELISSIMIYLCKIIVVINVCFTNLSSAESPKFSLLMIHISQMILDEGVVINEAINNKKYIILKGIAPNQRLAFLLAEKLFQSNMQKDFNFIDIIPFWNNNRFTFFLKKSISKIEQQSVVITEPNPRSVVSKMFVLKGKCSKDQTELNLSGTLTQNINCLNGSWSVQISTSQLNTNIIGLKVSEGIGESRSEDYRSFLIR